MISGLTVHWHQPNTSASRARPTSFLCPLPWQPLQVHRRIQDVERGGRWVKVTTRKEGHLGWTAILQQREPRLATTLHFNEFLLRWNRTTQFSVKVKGSTDFMILFSICDLYPRRQWWHLSKDCMTLLTCKLILFAKQPLLFYSGCMETLKNIFFSHFLAFFL